jgi:hypothetical protein
MRGPGMWMPKQKDGKNWIVNYTITKADGTVGQQSRKFRVRDDAHRFINRAKELRDDPRTDIVKFEHKVSKIEK